jgi:hypothetical protein
MVKPFFFYAEYLPKKITEYLYPFESVC